MVREDLICEFSWVEAVALGEQTYVNLVYALDLMVKVRDRQVEETLLKQVDDIVKLVLFEMESIDDEIQGCPVY